MAAGTDSPADRILVMRFHLPAFDHGVMDPVPARYVIRIKRGTSAPPHCPRSRRCRRGRTARTMLTGLLGQSALYGVLAEIEALSLDLLEVRQLEPQRKSPEPGDSRSP